MPLTPEQIAQSYNKAGVDTPAKLDAFLAAARPLITKRVKEAQIEAKREEQRLLNEQFEAAIQKLEAEASDATPPTTEV